MFNHWQCVVRWNVCCHVLGLCKLLWQCVFVRLTSTCDLLGNTAVWDVISCQHMISVRSPIIFKPCCRKIAILGITKSRVSSISFCSIFKSNRLEADLSRFFSMFPVKSVQSGFWTLPLVPFVVESAIDLTAILTRGITTLLIAVKTASWMQFSTALTLTAAFLLLSSALFSMI